MDIMLLARELGQKLAETPEMTKLKEYEARVGGDGKALALLEDFRNLQMEMVQAVRDQKEKQEVDAARLALMNKQDEINDYEPTREFLKAKEDVEGLMKTVNDMIVFGITGEEPCSEEKCSHCSGGCHH